MGARDIRGTAACHIFGGFFYHPLKATQAGLAFYLNACARTHVHQNVPCANTALSAFQYGLLKPCCRCALSDNTHSVVSVFLVLVPVKLSVLTKWPQPLQTARVWSAIDYLPSAPLNAQSDPIRSCASEPDGESLPSGQSQPADVRGSICPPALAPSGQRNAAPNS